MSDFWELGQFKEKRGGGKRFVRLGYAKQKDDGGFWLTFDALPVPDKDGNVSVSVNPPRERDDSQQGYTPGPRQTIAERPQPQGGMDMDSEIPFAPVWWA
jgi:hypothetical protein